MSDRTDSAWDEYLSTGEDPTGGDIEEFEEFEEFEEEEYTDEVIPGVWQQYSQIITTETIEEEDT